jgi:hypothetical protein
MSGTSPYLNSEADKLATTGLKRLQEKPIITPLDPNTEIQFHIYKDEQLQETLREQYKK